MEKLEKSSNCKILREYYYKALSLSLKRLEKLMNSNIQYESAIAFQEDRLHEEVCKPIYTVREIFQEHFKDFDNLKVAKMWQKVIEEPKIEDLSNQVDELYATLVDRYDAFLQKKISTKDGVQILEDVDLKLISKSEFDNFVESNPEKTSIFDTVLGALGLLEPSKEKVVSVVNQYIDQSKEKVTKAASQFKNGLDQSTEKRVKSENQRREEKRVSLKNENKKQMKNKLSQISEIVIENAQIELDNIVSAAMKASEKKLTRNQINYYLIANKRFQYVKEAESYLNRIIMDNRYNKEAAAKFFKAIDWKATRKELVGIQKTIDKKFSVLDKEFIQDGQIMTLRSFDISNLNSTQINSLIKKVRKMPKVKYQKKLSLIDVYKNFKNRKYNTLNTEQQDLINKLDKLIRKAKKVSQGKVTLEEARHYLYSKDFQFVERASKMIEDFAKMHSQQQANEVKKSINWLKKKREISTIQKNVDKKFSNCNKEFMQGKQIISLNNFDLWSMSEKRFNKLYNKIKRKPNNIRELIKKENDKALFNVYNKGTKLLNSPRNKMSIKKVKLLKEEIQKINEPEILKQLSVENIVSKLDSFIASPKKRIKSYRILLKQIEAFISEISTNNMLAVTIGYKRKATQLALGALSGIIAAVSLSAGAISLNSQAKSKEPENQKESYSRSIDKSILLSKNNIDMLYDSLVEPIKSNVEEHKVYGVSLTSETVQSSYEELIDESTIGIAKETELKKEKVESATKDESNAIISSNVLLKHESNAIISSNVLLKHEESDTKVEKDSKEINYKVSPDYLEKKAAQWVCDYYGMSMDELNNFADTFISTSNVLEIGLTDKMSVYNYLYEISQISNEEKKLIAMERLGLTPSEFDTVINTFIGEAAHRYSDGYGVGSTGLMRITSQAWIASHGTNLCNQVTAPRQYTVYLTGSYLNNGGERNSMRYQGILDALYSGIPVHLYSSFEFSESTKYDFQYTSDGNCYGNYKTDFDTSIFQYRASYFSEDYSREKTLEFNQDKAA